MSTPNKPSHFNLNNAARVCIVLFVLYRISASTYTVLKISESSLQQKNSVRSEEIVQVIDQSIEGSTSYLFATFDFNEYIKPSLSYIFNTYNQLLDDAPIT